MAPSSDEADPLDEWAADLIEEVYQEWKKNYSDLEGGAKVFYTPVRESPKLLILGYQPGGEAFGRKARFEAGNFYPPNRNRLLDADYPFAREMRRLFDGRSDLLKNSVYSNLIFFRSRGIDAWEARGKARVEAAEAFCFSKNREIIETLKPENILLIGIQTFVRFKKIFSDLITARSAPFSGERGRVLCSRGMEGGRIVGIKHLTGGWGLSSEEWEILEEQLWQELDIQ